MLKYELGEMWGIDGSALEHEVWTKTAEYAIRISQCIESISIYKKLCERLPSQRLLLYFQKLIKEEVYPYIRQACVIQWYKRTGTPIPQGEDVVLVPDSGIFGELKKCWGFEDIPIRIKERTMFDIFNFVVIRKLLKRVYDRLSKVGAVLEGSERSFVADKGGIIACHYNEGFDPMRRNDLNWFYNSGVDPKDVLIYFDGPDNKTGRPITLETIKQIEKLGIRWVALKKGIIENQKGVCWQPPQFPKNWGLKKIHTRSHTERWVIEVGNDLLKQVYYWRSFYDKFNIKIGYIPEEGFAKSIAQAIAFDIQGSNSGLQLGKQRSEFFLPITYYMGHHPKHIFFVWNQRVKHYLSPNCEQINGLIITGYPNNIFNGHRQLLNKKILNTLRSKGVKFIITLFDNAYGADMRFSFKGMSSFYQLFLQWILDDPAVGLIIKPKKPKYFNNLPSANSLFKRAFESGRCVKIEGSWGKFPSDASFGADMAIGCGISASVTEAVIAGCKGIHYDMANLKNHEFYSWGYNRIIFNDSEKLMVALMKYKENPESEPGLGDWSSYLDKLDPFRDGRGGERMGVYMRWLLERFDKGAGRDEAIHYANDRYAERWGADKVIDMNSQVRGEYAESF